MSAQRETLYVGPDEKWSRKSSRKSKEHDKRVNKGMKCREHDVQWELREWEEQY